MRTLRRILLAVLVVALLAVGVLGWFVWQWQHPPGPVYDGKPLHVWLQTYKQSPHDTGTETAVREIGTNTLPVIGSMMTAKDSPFKTQVITFINQRKWKRLHIDSADERRRMALGAFETLGEAAEPAIPSLVQALNDEETSDIAALALTYVGPQCVWPLAQGLLSSNATVRKASLRVLAEYRPFSDENGDYIVSEKLKVSDPTLSPNIPALIKRLKDSDPLMRGIAAECLGFFHQEPATVVPALTELLRDKERMTRLCVFFALCNYREAAKPAVPALLEAIIKEDDFMIRTDEYRWVKQIDPDVSEASNTP